MLVVVGSDRLDRLALRGVDDDELAAVGALERLAGKDGVRLAERDLLAMEAQDEVESARALDVVGGHEHSASLAAQLREDLADALRAHRVDAVKRLVEQQRRRVLDEGACQQDTLPLPARELAKGVFA